MRIYIYVPELENDENLQLWDERSRVCSVCNDKSPDM